MKVVSEDDLFHLKPVQLGDASSSCFAFTCEPEQLRTPPNRKSVFGGQLFALALHAASLAFKGSMLPNSAHAYFIRPAVKDAPLNISVEPVHKGRSFARCRVAVEQRNAVIIDMIISLVHTMVGEEPTPEPPHYRHSVIAPKAQPPPPMAAGSKTLNNFDENAPSSVLEMVECALEQENHKGESVIRVGVWMRARSNVELDSVMSNLCYLACMTDALLLPTGLRPHFSNTADPKVPKDPEDPEDPINMGLVCGDWEKKSGAELAASLDHSLWVHSWNFRADDWLLLDIRTTRGTGVRVMSEARVWTKTGEHIATTIQEGFALQAKERTA